MSRPHADDRSQQVGRVCGVAAALAADGELVIFNRGNVGLAVRASAADRDNFDPVRIGSDIYTDADEISPMPVRAARRLGAVVIAVDVSAYAESTPEGVPQNRIDKDRRRAAQIADEAREVDIYLHPHIGYYAGHSEKYRRRVIATAERYAGERVAAIRAALSTARNSASSSP